MTWFTFSFFKLISQVFNIWLHRLFKVLNFSLIALMVLLKKMTVSFHFMSLLKCPICLHWLFFINFLVCTLRRKQGILEHWSHRIEDVAGKRILKFPFLELIGMCMKEILSLMLMSLKLLLYIYPVYFSAWEQCFFFLSKLCCVPNKNSGFTGTCVLHKFVFWVACWNSYLPSSPMDRLPGNCPQSRGDSSYLSNYRHWQVCADIMWCLVNPSQKRGSQA